MPFWGNLYNVPTGATAPVYTRSVLGSLFSPTTATGGTIVSNRAWYDNTRDGQTQTATTSWYATSLANQTATSSTATTWSIDWANDDMDHIQYITLAQNRVVRTRARTAEQQREFEERRLLRQQQELVMAQERAIALARSEELLLEHLTPAQRRSFQGMRFFVVEGGRSRQAYRIRDIGSYSGNVDVLEGTPGKVTHRLCCHLSDSRVPLYDHLLAQKVWIETDEDAFLRQANRHAA